MSLLSKIKRNVPRVSLGDYFWVVSGIPKSGKTTLFANLVKEHFGNADAGLLVAFEKGYLALDINKIDIENWEEFESLVDELVENRDEVPYKFIGLDTVDVMYEMAVDAVIKEWNRKNPSKRTNDIAGVGARGNSDQGFGVGYSYVKTKIRKALDKLQKAGFGVMAITHSKDKKVEQRDGEKFDQLTLSIPGTAREVFVNAADFVVFITVEKEKTKSGEVENKRYIYWRTDGYVEAGSRFTNLPERTEYDVKVFLETFRNAVESSLGSGVDIKKLEKEQTEENERKAKEFIESLKSEDTVEGLVNKIKAITDTLNKEQKKELAKKFANEFGSANFMEYDDIDQLKSALEMASEYVEN